jgi:hypothetical protein
MILRRSNENIVDSIELFCYVAPNSKPTKERTQMAAKKGSKKSRGARKGGGKAGKKGGSKSRSRGGAKKSTKKAAKKSTKKGGKKAAKKGTKKAAKRSTGKRGGGKKRPSKYTGPAATPAEEAPLSDQWTGPIVGESEASGEEQG